MKVIVLGAGLVGNAIIRDLANDKDIHVLGVDRSEEALAALGDFPQIALQQADLSQDGTIPPLVEDCDLVVSAVPGFMGFQVLKELIQSGKNLVDISFFNENPFDLDDLAREQGVTAVVDCGVAPGLCNIIAGNVVSKLDNVHSYQCLVGGLPQDRQWPYEYKAVFSPADVLEEYTRPARMVENGQEVICPALSGVELVEFPLVGTLEAFNTDGLRTMLHTLDIPNMREKTLRYPGHAELMRIFRESGFFSPYPIKIDGQQVKPLSLTSQLLFDQWHLEPGEKDLTVMQVILEGTSGQEKIIYQYDLLDRYDSESGTTSMARTTGYTCTSIARQLLKGIIPHKGICPPEFLGAIEGGFEDLLQQLAARNIHLQEQVTKKPLSAD